MFDFRKGGRWIGTARGFLFENRDVGLTWTAVTAAGPEPFHSLIPDPADADEAFAAGAQGLYHSEQKGRNWRLVSSWRLVGGSEQIYPQLYAVPGTRPIYITFSGESGRIRRNNVAVSLNSGVSFMIVQTEVWGVQVATAPEGGLYTSRPPEPDAFVAKFDASGRPIFFTYLGGESFDEATSVSVDSNDDIVVGGRTKSASFPGDWSYGEDRGGFVVKLRGDGTRLQWASRFPAPENAVYFTTAAGAGDTFYVYGFESLARGPYFLQMASSDGRTILRDVRPAPFGGKMRLEANGDLLLGGNPVTRFRAATGKTETLTESYLGLTFTSARVGADGNLWVFGGVTRGFDGQGAAGVTSGAFQRLIAGTIDLLPGNIREGYIGKFSPEGKLLAGTLYGGEQMETILDGFADAGGNVLAIGTTSSRKLPMRSPLDMRLMPGGETGFALKMNSTLSELTMATYLTEFEPAAILPHPEGGYWLIGSGREDAGSRSFKDIYLKRIRSSPAELPRVDSVSADPAKFIALQPGGTAFLTGEGFTNETVVEFGSYPVAPRAVEATRMQALVPGNIPGGIYDVTVVTKGRRSAPVRVRLFPLE